MTADKEAGIKGIAILGSTGSIGTAALDVVRRHSDRYRVTALAANSRTDELLAQAREFGVTETAVFEDANRAEFLEAAPSGITCTPGIEGLMAVAAHPGADIVVNALVGAIGVRPTLRALEAGKRVALANKETLVMAGRLVMEASDASAGGIVPVDSEHGALHQCLHCGRTDEVRRIILTASGGPFRTTPAAEFSGITVEDALAHPTWNMGSKITVDSATMMNKGLEVIEARWLFGTDGGMIDVVVHPESIIHSMVEYADRSVIAQLSSPDMRLPIQYALAYPERLESEFAALDPVGAGSLTFEAPDFDRFPCLRLAFDALHTGGSMPCVLNAANEVAVAAFLSRGIGFTDIPRIVAGVMEDHRAAEYGGLDEIMGIDAWARQAAAAVVRKGN